ncbi:MAG: 2-C-methyl-D-erythritol 2,4-cyclodiphosphate synthase [Arenicella sp.]|jgi:2-C-methyl-D-erythritol 2,4-cyclodiphosphate synthase
MASKHPCNFRTGFGVDRHQLVSARKLILGGIEIESDLGSLGHSDADVLIHAICDSILGAANLRDIGFHFPDTSEKFKDIDSSILLKESLELVHEKGYLVGNIDCTIMLESPKLSEFIPYISKNIALLLKVDEDAVSIKATRGEKVGPVGRREAIQAYCSCLIYLKES